MGVIDTTEGPYEKVPGAPATVDALKGAETEPSPVAPVTSTTKPKREPWKSEDVIKALRERHDPKAWAFMTEVRNATGYKRSARYVDAIAMSLWPSRGLDIHGFEVKVSRADWKKELESPEKAEEIARFCDRWWLVVADANIVKPGELPSTWGLMVRRGDALVATVEAPKLSPQPLSTDFLAACLRSAQGQLSPAAEIARARVEARAEGVAWAEQHAKDYAGEAERSVAALEKALGIKLADFRFMEEGLGTAVREVLAGRHLTLASDVAAFEKAAGVKITDVKWPEPYASEVGAALRLVLASGAGNHGIESFRRNLENASRTLENAAKSLRAVLEGPKIEAADTGEVPA